MQSGVFCYQKYSTHHQQPFVSAINSEREPHLEVLLTVNLIFGTFSSSESVRDKKTAFQFGLQRCELKDSQHLHACF